MFNLGAFAGGLAEGIRSGGEMELKRRLAERAARSDERAAEIHHARMDKAAFNKDRRDRLRAANDEIAADWREARQQPARPTMTDPDQSSSGSAGLVNSAIAGEDLEKSDAPISMGGLRSKTPAARPDSGVAANAGGGGLMSRYKRPMVRKDPDDALMPADEMIGRRMLTGNLLQDTDALTRMANIYKKHGLLQEMAPWMNKVYRAKKKGIPDALHFLLNGDAKAAREALKQGGINLVDDPVPANPDDPQNYRWKFRLENGGEQDTNLKELAAGFFPSSILSR
jgi:hypothetical protein